MKMCIFKYVNEHSISAADRKVDDTGTRNSKIGHAILESRIGIANVLWIWIQLKIKAIWVRLSCKYLL